jgi:RNA polymerase sigma-70 factor (ECF subfamily)
MPEVPSRSFPDLIAAAAQGDREALDEVVRQYEPRIRVVARVLLGPALRPYLDSVDLTQSVHKSILIGLRANRFAIAEPDQLVGLALTILRRKANKFWRHLQRQQRLSGAGSVEANELPDLLTALSSPTHDPASVAQFRDQVEHLCSQLDRTERQILDMRLEGFTPAEIADKLAVSRVALRVRLTRLRQRLQSTGVLTDWL